MTNQQPRPAPPAPGRWVIHRLDTEATQGCQCGSEDWEPNDKRYRYGCACCGGIVDYETLDNVAAEAEDARAERLADLEAR